MVVELMLIALILVLCIIADKFSGKFGMPALFCLSESVCCLAVTEL